MIIGELGENHRVASMLLVLYECRCRSVVLTVSGTGLSTRRSPSVMRLISISWRWTGTAEMPAMLLWMRTGRTGMPTEWSSVPQTKTTISSLVFTALHTLNTTADGGTIGAVQIPSTEMMLVFGSLSVTSKTCKPVACSSNSISKPADDRVSSHSSGVTREEGADRPGDTIQGVTPVGTKMWANLQRIAEKRGRTGKKGVGWHPGGRRHPSESNKKR